ncbi:MAG: haloacid dehalogenase-like hydrolase [Sulfurovaceae bacterium]|nr:haloacid dehalogenase-like hydrolase [Sulfurovaceae bacterium]MDD5549619.1 haloacid dehalogenase-like hydrolase [Sulfurovaceae bacterium]
MKHKIMAFLSITISMLLFCLPAMAKETHPEPIISKIMNTKQAILKSAKDPSSSKFIFLAFWDFDGTILKGDCSEGLDSNGTISYKGLAELAINSGYSSIYPPKGGADKFWKDYRHMEQDIGKWLAYPFIPQMLYGAKLSDIHKLSEKYFSKVLSDYYFISSIQILKALEKDGVECHVISASADVFLDAAAPTLGLDVSRFHGIEVRIKDGRLTRELVYPVTYSDGKREKLMSIVKEIARQHPDKQVIVLAAFGNSYGTDGPFMKYVATQTLPTGHPVAVMINGGNSPTVYRDLFVKVEQSETVGKH